MKTNAPYYNGSSYTKYTTKGKTLEAADDAAKVILGGDWQIPTQEIWNALCDATTVVWGDKQLVSIEKNTNKGMKITKNDDSGIYLFLPAAGRVNGTSFEYVGTLGLYWSGTAYSKTDANYLNFSKGSFYAHDYNTDRYYGLSVRPVRLVAVN